MTIHNKFNLQQIVFLLHDKEQDPRMITAIQIDLIGLQYRLAFGTDYSWHYEQELTDMADTLKRLG